MSRTYHKYNIEIIKKMNYIRIIVNSFRYSSFFSLKQSELLYIIFYIIVKNIPDVKKAIPINISLNTNSIITLISFISIFSISPFEYINSTLSPIL